MCFFIIFKMQFVFLRFNRQKTMRRGNIKLRLMLFAGIALFSLMKFYFNTDSNEYTGKKQHITLTENRIAHIKAAIKKYTK